ncbi:hypothetical protein [Lelliottia amnigena]|uniref:hypothetical protein n=1 Tax=Lelliottia amnigena TaxID=61646 RepID=UPI0040561CD1
MSKINREQFEAWGMSDTDLRITLECETYAGIAWLAWQAATNEAEAKNTAITSQLESVVAENAALKAFGDKLDEMHNDLNGEGTGIQGRAEVACQQVALEAAMEEFDAIKTPATDAFLAEVRASGVEMFASHLRTNDNGASVCKMIALGADEFAAQLRQGGAE